MPTSYTPLLGFALPTTGELSGTWGTTVNEYITRYVDASIAGTQTISTDANVTLSVTNGTTLTSTSAQYAIINLTGVRSTVRSVSLPFSSKSYIVLNNTTGGYAVVVGGVSVANGERCIIAYDTSAAAFFKVSASSVTNNATGFSITAGTTPKTLTVAQTLSLDGVSGKALSVNKNLTLDGADGKTLSVNNSIGLSGTDGSTLNVGAGGTLGSAAFTASTAYPTTTGTNATGTWGISITGSAGSVAWTNVTSRPTAVSAFTNDAGYLTSSGSVVYATNAGSVPWTGVTGTNTNVQFLSLGVGTSASGTTGEIRATNNITAYYSSDRSLKENIRDIPGAVNAVEAIGGKLFDWTDAYIKSKGGADGYFVQKSDFGVVAQDVQAAFPLAVREREDGTLAVDYEKLCALAFAAIKELSARVKELEAR